jgi:hypothetical protein
MNPRVFLCFDGHSVKGPFTLEDLRGAVSRGEVAKTTSACEEGGETWQPLGDLRPEAFNGAQPLEITTKNVPQSSFVPRNSYERAVHEAVKRNTELEKSSYANLSLDRKVEKYVKGGASRSLRVLSIYLPVVVVTLLLSALLSPMFIWLAVAVFFYLIYKVVL